MNSNDEFVATTIKMLDKILRRVNNLQDVFNKMDKRISALEKGTSVAISKTFTPETEK